MNLFPENIHKSNIGDDGEIATLHEYRSAAFTFSTVAAISVGEITTSDHRHFSIQGKEIGRCRVRE